MARDGEEFDNKYFKNNKKDVHFRFDFRVYKRNFEFLLYFDFGAFEIQFNGAADRNFEGF